MTIWSAVGALGGALLGGMFGRDANEDSRANAEAMAQHGVRWRVADAKAAGLHPLFALGGTSPQPAAAQPIMTAAEGAAMGQNVGRAIGAANDEARQARANLALTQAQTAKTEMERLAIASELARQGQEARQAVPVPVGGTPGVSEVFPVRIPDIKEVGTWVDGIHQLAINHPPSPAERAAAASPYLTNAHGEAARSLKRWAVPGLGEVLLPDAQNLAEAMESLENPVNQGLILGANAYHYGPRVVEALRKHLREVHRKQRAWRVP